MMVAILDGRAGEVVIDCSIRLANTRIRRRHVDTAIEVLVQVGELVTVVSYLIRPFLVAAIRASMVC